MSVLDRIKVVLVETSHPGNIGGVARAMKNMGLRALVLVNPIDFPAAEATARASGADDLLADAMVVNSLAEGVADCQLVFGTSARQRRLSCPQFDVREAALKVVSASAEENIALVFGRERTGLTNDELGLCHYLMSIPVDSRYASLNLAAAVQVVSYECRMAFLSSLTAGVDMHSQEPVKCDELASHSEMEGYYEHLERVLIATEFLDPDQPKHLMHRLRLLYNRSHVTKKEANILRGILTAVEKASS